MDVTPACDSSGLPQGPQGLQFGCWKLVNSRVNEKGGDNVGSRESKNERAEFYRHSGPYRKVTFERTIARLFGRVCCYE